MNFSDFGIEIIGNRVQQKLVCPNCVKEGKQQTKDKCLSVNIIKKIWNCHKCAWKGKLPMAESKMQYELPPKRNFTKLSDNNLQYFSSRGISQSVVMRNKIFEGNNGWIIFPYFRNFEMINYKARSGKEKDFRQHQNAEPIMYKYDDCVDQKEIIICEGEFDCLSFEQAGYEYTTSVNAGAPNANDKTADKRLECLGNCVEMFDSAEKIYIAVDKDTNGKRLEAELVRRLGADKCWIVEFPEGCKDANEVLVNHGKEKLVECINVSKQVRISGVTYLSDVAEQMIFTFENGKKRGATTNFPAIDPHFKWKTGDLTLWTGYNNEGKSKLLLQLALAKAKHDEWKWAVFNPENLPADEFFDDIIHAYVGKSTDKHYGNVMSKKEYIEAMEFVNEYFISITPETDSTIATIEEKFEYCIKRYGVKGLILDPYNQVDHLSLESGREDLYISKFMTGLKKFAVKHDVCYNLVAHQNTPVFQQGKPFPKPSLYRIKGGGTFSDKADNVIIVFRPNRNVNYKSTDVEMHVEKIKKQILVGVPGMVMMDFDVLSNRYYINGDTPLGESVKLPERISAPKEPKQEEFF